MNTQIEDEIRLYRHEHLGAVSKGNTEGDK
jgi:hypothetical protein